MQLIECIPNFSEGRDADVISQIADSIRSVARVKLLHVDSGYDANRTVMTFVGAPDAVVEAAFRGMSCACRLIDMRVQQGEHPRIGATDVCPLVPISDVSMAEVVGMSNALAQRVGTELGVPVFMYERSAKSEARRRLEQIRKGEYEGLAARMAQGSCNADYGPKEFNYKTGCTVIGARDFLIAFNVNLSTKSEEIAHKIACRIRASGSRMFSEDKLLRLKGLKAIAWYMDAYACSQVSTNITDVSALTLFDVYESVRTLAEEYGVSVNGSELIGLLPRSVLLDCGKSYAAQEGTATMSSDELISLAVDSLGLSAIEPFRAEDRIIEALVADVVEGVV
ncbi:MAG: glutamate formimidoyltransferase [Bacteroidales bacterium]